MTTPSTPRQERRWRATAFSSPTRPDNADDPVVADVMSGYGVISAEIRDQVEAAGHRRPTHLFVQAGVGGLACAMAEGLEIMDGAARHSGRRRTG